MATYNTSGLNYLWLLWSIVQLPIICCKFRVPIATIQCRAQR